MALNCLQLQLESKIESCPGDVRIGFSSAKAYSIKDWINP